MRPIQPAAIEDTLKVFNMISKHLDIDNTEGRAEVHYKTGPTETYPGHWWGEEPFKGNYSFACYYASKDPEVHLEIDNLLQQVHTIYVEKEKLRENDAPTTIWDRPSEAIYFLKDVNESFSDVFCEIRTVSGKLVMIKMSSVSQLRESINELQKLVFA